MSLSSAGNLTVSGDASIGDDLTLASDASVLKFGADGDINITHVHNTGLTSNGTLDVAGDITGSTLNADGDTAAGDNAAIGFTSAEGLILTGQGSTNDVTIKNDADADVAVIPTGTTNFGFDSGYGSVVTAFGVRAWVNFNGTGTVAIRGSGNVSSITDNGTGDYTVTMATALPDINYTYTLSTMSVSHATTNAINQNTSAAEVAQTTTTFRFVTRIVGGAAVDTKYNNAIITR